MTDEELAEEYVSKNNIEWELECHRTSPIGEVIQAFLSGLKAGRPQWHKVADGDLPKGDEGYGETSIHRKIYLKDRDGNMFRIEEDFRCSWSQQKVIAWKYLEKCTNAQIDEFREKAGCL